jgi:galactosylceramidase
MKEAKKRNPAIKLYGLPWGWPGWLDPTASATVMAKNSFADANITANYTLAFLLGAKREHGLNMDYIGQWNERNAPKDYNDALRRVVGEAPELENQTTVLNRLPHYPGSSDEPDPHGCTQYPWDLADGSRWTDEEGSIFDGRSARCLARCVNRGYVTGCHTATFQWHLISSFYDYLPWARDGVAVANEPWSGHYEVTSPTWSLAHTTQFSPPGWRMLSHDSGSSLLASGGSIVTRISPDKQDWSAVIEKMTTKVRYLSPISGITDLSIIVGELIISFVELLGPEFQR